MADTAVHLEQSVNDTAPELVFDEPGLAACYVAAAQGVSVSTKVE